MKLKTAIKILEYHQEWRRGAEIPMINPTRLGVAIDLILKEVKKTTYSIDDIEKCVEHWGLCKVERSHIKKFLKAKN